MKENLKVNILWLLLLLAGYGLISVLVSVGVLNLFYVQILQQIGINIILAVGLNLIVGFSGQFSLGHAGFMAIGAYAAAIIGSKSPTYGAFFGAMLIGALLSGAVALLVGIPTLRLKGDYLAVATLGVSEIIRIFIINGGSLTNGAAGILGIPNFTTWQMVYFFVVITTIATLNFLRSPIGRSTSPFVRMKSPQSQSVLIQLKLKSSLLSLVPLLQVLQGHFRQDLSVQLYRKITLSSTQSTF